MNEKKKTVKCLLVDDRGENLIALEAILHRDNLELLKARSSREALELLLVHDFALAIVDVHMPDIDGFELVELMRGSERARGTPIIFVTAGGHDAARRFQGYEAGAVDFLFKPLDAKILGYKVDVFLELFRQRSELAENLRLNEEFVAIVTHDFRSPLATIMMVADLLKKETTDDHVGKQMDRILRTSRQLLATVNELLDMSYVRRTEGIPVDPRTADLEAIIRRAVTDVKTAHPHQVISFDAKPAGFLGLFDSGRMEQVVTNLLSNAIAHGTPGTPIDVSLARCDEGFHFAVKNCGTIPPDVLPALFLPFQNGHAKRTKTNGLGLGLYIVEQIVIAHGGRVSATSRDNVTCMDVYLPRNVPIKVKNRGRKP